MCELEGKTALVTGATGGIGQAIARELASRGAKLAITGTRAEALEKLAAELGGEVMAAPCDLGDGEAIIALVKQVEAELGSLDILVNNAGITKDGLALRMKDADWEAVLALNLTASFRLCRASMRGMLKRGFGRMINISSVVGVMGNPGQANYCASKAGMIGMSKSLAQEVAAKGVTVNCIAPGFIETPMTADLNDEQQERITRNIPAQRFGKPEDVAAAAAFLADERAGYITGQTLHVNGGLLMV